MKDDDDEAALYACQLDIVEAFKRHGVAAAYTLQRPSRYLVGMQLLAPHSLLRETSGTYGMDVREQLETLSAGEVEQLVGLTLSLLSALRDGEAKNAQELATIHASLMKYLKGLGVKARNLGPRKLS